jgi:predicted dehydrogenase
MDNARPRLRVAIVGAGMIGRAHAHAFRMLRELGPAVPADVDLPVVADVDPHLAADAQRRYGFERTADSWQAVADAPDVDIACIVLPNKQHREASAACLAAGKHVLCEKPLAASASDAWAMLQAARGSGKVHGVGFNLRRTPAVAALRGIVAAGGFGQVQQFNARYFTDYAASPNTPFTWRYQRNEAGSGALGDIGSHIIDLGRSLIGEIESIRGATLETFVRERPVPAGHAVGHAHVETTGEMRAVDTDDVAAFEVRFQDGALGSFRCSRIAAGYRNSPAFELLGADASAEFDMERAGEFQFYTRAQAAPTNGFRRVVVGPHQPGFTEISTLPVAGAGTGYTDTYAIQAWQYVQAVASGQPFQADFEDGYRVMLICEAVQRAAEQGRAVPIAEIVTEVEAAQ